MKKLLLLLLLPLFIACEKEVQEPTQFRLSPDAKIRIEAVKSGTQRVISDSTEIDTIHLSALEVVKQAWFPTFGSEDEYGYYHENSEGAWFVEKDTISENPALLRRSDEIVNDVTGYGDYVIQLSALSCRDYTIVRRGTTTLLDTIAYIPNSYWTDAIQEILNAIDNKDTLAVYDIYQNTFRFIPITGAEYRVLKEQGLQ